MADREIALIVGVRGWERAYATEHLRSDGIEVYGLKRRWSDQGKRGKRYRPWLVLAGLPVTSNTPAAGYV